MTLRLPSLPLLTILTRRGFVLPLLLAVCAAPVVSAQNNTSLQNDTEDRVSQALSASLRNYEAEIRRTSMGVPHIKANSWGDLGYGYAYAQAEDNLCTMADAFLTYRGERSRYLGPEAGPLAGNTLEVASNLDSDFFHRHVISPVVLSAMKAAQPQELRELVDGFAAGYNRYLRHLKSGSNTAHAACRYARWVRPISSDDIYRRMMAANLAGGYSNFANSIASAQPPAAGVTGLRKAAPAKLLPGQIKLPSMQVGGKHGLGSNMIAYGSAATDNGSALLFGNPHWYWRGNDRFYQAQLTIPGKLNVSGASFLGVPMILLGYNDNVAWSHTVSAARRFGFFELTLASDDATSYLRDGKKIKMTAVPLTVKVLQADGRIGQVKRTLYNSEYGPMANLGLLNPALEWNAGTAFAIRDINAGNFRSFRNWLRWNTAGSLDEFIRIQKQEMGTPWVNTAAIGRGSHQVWFADMGAVPNVSAAQQLSCTTPIGQMIAAVLPRVPFFDGSQSSCDWQTDRDSAQKGSIGTARLPSLMRSDYVANMNDSYWSTNPKVLLTGYPDIMGDAGTASLSMRSRLGHMLAQGRLDGSDAYAGNKANMQNMKQMVLNSRALTGELFKAQALPLVCTNPQITLSGDPETGETLPAQNIDVRAACAALRSWDNSGNPSARAAHVWDEFWRRAALLPEAQLYRVQFDPRDPVHTPRDLNNVAAPALQQAFAAAVLRVQNSGFAMTARRGETLFVTRNLRKIGLYGGCETSGYFTVACSAQRLDQGGYSMDNSSYSNSYMQLVSFPAGGVEAHTFLTHSLSDDVASPRYSNYTDRYANKDWLRVPFSERDIRNDAAYSTTMVSEWSRY
ncbi:N-acyl homoserine lactone acylase QqaR [soil metagenome]